MTKIFSDINLQHGQVQNVRVHNYDNLNSLPLLSESERGEVAFVVSEKKFYGWVGNNWKEMGSSSGGDSNFRITGKYSAQEDGFFLDGLDKTFDQIKSAFDNGESISLVINEFPNSMSDDSTVTLLITEYVVIDEAIYFGIDYSKYFIYVVIYSNGNYGEIEDFVAKPMKSVTYSQLKDLRDNKELVPGMQYRITDYVTATAQENTISAKHKFNVIVTADSENTLNENARAVQDKDDGYFKTSNLAAWELKYCLDNDANRFQWADKNNGEGVIYYMKDEFGNECPYDFKNIMFKCSNIKSVDGDTLHSLVGKIIPHDNYSSIDFGGDEIYIYTFNANIFGTQMDNSLPINPHDFNSAFVDRIITPTALNTIKPCMMEKMISDYIYDDKIAIQTLNSVTFNSTVNSLDGLAHLMTYGNEIGNCCRYIGFGDGNCDNVIGKSSHHIVLGDGCYNNTFGEDNNNNYLGDDSYDNTFGNGCCDNVFDNDCISNKFKDDCTENIFGGECYNNTFGGECENNHLGESCSYNVFGDLCSSNGFKNNCQNNIFDINCRNNIFSVNVMRNKFGSDFIGNKFGSGISDNTFGANCYGNNFGKGIEKNTFGNGCYNNTFGNDFYGNTIMDNVYNIAIRNNAADGTLTSEVYNCHIFNGTKGSYGEINIRVDELTGYQLMTPSASPQFIGIDTNGKVRISTLDNLFGSSTPAPATATLNTILYNSDSEITGDWVDNNTDSSQNTYDASTGDGVLYLNDGVDTIGGEGDRGGLRALNIDSPFYTNSNVRSVDMSNCSIATIGSYAFYGCENLINVILPKGVKDIGDNSFSYCELNSIDVPKNTEKISVSAFEGVLNINYDGTASGSPWGAKAVNAQTYTNGLMYDVKADGCAIVVGCLTKANGPIIIPSDIVINNKNYNVTAIGDFAFRNCVDVTSVEMPSTIETLGHDIFDGCVIIDEKGIVSGTTIQSVYAQSEIPPSIETDTFSNKVLIPTLYVSNESALDEYGDDKDGWCAYFDIILIQNWIYNFSKEGSDLKLVGSFCEWEIKDGLAYESEGNGEKYFNIGNVITESDGFKLVGNSTWDYNNGGGAISDKHQIMISNGGNFSIGQSKYLYIVVNTNYCTIYGANKPPKKSEER